MDTVNLTESAQLEYVGEGGPKDVYVDENGSAPAVSVGTRDSSLYQIWDRETTTTPPPPIPGWPPSPGGPDQLTLGGQASFSYSPSDSSKTILYQIQSGDYTHVELDVRDS